VGISGHMKIVDRIGQNRGGEYAPVDGPAFEPSPPPAAEQR
jgi:hypothetical protein